MYCHLADVLVDMLAEMGVLTVIDPSEGHSYYLRFGVSLDIQHHPSPMLIVKTRQVVLEMLARDLAEHFETRGGKQLCLLRKHAGRSFRDATLPQDPLYFDIAPIAPADHTLASEGLPSRVSAWCYCLVEQALG